MQYTYCVFLFLFLGTTAFNLPSSGLRFPENLRSWAQGSEGKGVRRRWSHDLNLAQISSSTPPNIVLIGDTILGSMCLGRALAMRLNYSFTQLDDAAEEVRSACFLSDAHSLSHSHQRETFPRLLAHGSALLWKTAGDWDGRQ